MRIISKFHDYYDGVMQHGFDESIVYLRQSVEVDLTNPASFNKSCRDLNKCLAGTVTSRMLHYTTPIFYKNLSVTVSNPIVVMVCDKFYHGVRVIIADNFNTRVDTYVFSVEQLAQLYKQMSLDDAAAEFEAAHRNQTRRFDRANMLDRPRRHKNISMWLSNDGFETVRACERVVLTTARNDRIVCLMVSSEHVTVNPQLSRFNFAAVVPPYEIAQEISMFIGGVLGSPAGSMVSISDADKIQQHGFNEWSFRTLPTKHKK